MCLAFYVIASYQYFKFHLIPLHSFRDILLPSNKCQRRIGAPVAQWVKGWPNDLAVPGSDLARSEIF